MSGSSLLVTLLGCGAIFGVLMLALALTSWRSSGQLREKVGFWIPAVFGPLAAAYWGYRLVQSLMVQDWFYAAIFLVILIGMATWAWTRVRLVLRRGGHD